MLRLYWRLVWARERSAMQYRVSFALSGASSMLAWLVEIAAILSFFLHIPSFAGWSAAEVALLYGLGATAFSIAELFATGFEELPRHLRQGSFDRVLVRPHGAFFQTLAAGLRFQRIGRVVQCLAIALIALASLDVPWTVDKALVLLLALASGVAIYLAIFILGAAYTFWTVQGTEVINVFTNGGQMITSYPLDAYGAWLRRTLTFVVPLGFITYYPTLYLLDRPGALGLPHWAGALSPLVAALFVVAASQAWSVGVRKYRSTGS